MPSSKIPFKTAYGERTEEYITPSGTGIEDQYGYEINSYGQKEFVKIGEINLYEKIQESLEETKIENILARVAMGDNSVMRPDGIYADVSESPKNLIEARQQMQKLENLWNGLSREIKEKYDFSVEKFIGSSGSNAWLEDMGLISKTDTSSKENTNTIKESEATTE